MMIDQYPGHNYNELGFGLVYSEQTPIHYICIKRFTGLGLIDGIIERVFNLTSVLITASRSLKALCSRDDVRHSQNN